MALTHCTSIEELIQRRQRNDSFWTLYFFLKINYRRHYIGNRMARICVWKSIDHRKQRVLRTFDILAVLLFLFWSRFSFFSSVRHVTNFEIFRMREKDIPVDVLELKEKIVAFAWEPKVICCCLCVVVVWFFNKNCWYLGQTILCDSWRRITSWCFVLHCMWLFFFVNCFDLLLLGWEEGNYFAFETRQTTSKCDILVRHYYLLRFYQILTTICIFVLGHHEERMSYWLAWKHSTDSWK